MFNTLQIYDELSQTMDQRSARQLVNVMSSMYEELRNSVTKEEFADLKEVVHELAEAQKRTEIRVEELAEAQKRTEHALLQLSKRVDQTNQHVGGLNMTVGYSLENEAYRCLPDLMRRDWQIEVTEPLRRDWLPTAAGKMVEVNIVGQGQREGETLLILGESKLQLSRKYVDAFLHTRFRKIATGGLTAFPVIITHMEAEPGVVAYARARGVAVYLSYQFHRANLLS